MQEFIYSMRRGKGRYQIMGTHSVFNNQRTETVARETLAWLCAQPLMRKQTIVASQFAEGSSENRNKTHGSPLGQINIAPGMLPERAPPGAARIRFCVDSKGRVADTVIEQSSPRGLYDKLAREVLGKSGFFARKIGNTAVLTCGLTVSMRFSGDKRGTVGKIGKMRFTVLTNVSPVPRLKRQKSVKIALNIPAGTRLPRVARVEIRFCIRKNGTVFEPIVIRAEPKQYFDQAALETVKEWQFGLLPKPMCDVYEWTRFPLGSR
jgi:TonB family protein